VVTRRVGQGVRVDGPARFVILEILDSTARIAIEAPETTKVLRDELTEGRGG
jgi:carbon storage regulator CsrA